MPRAHEPLDPKNPAHPAAGSATLRGASGLLRAVDRASAALIIGLMAVMVATISAQVFLRYGLNSSIDWADELARVTFVWVIFLAVPQALAAGRHVGIEMVTSRLSAATASRVHRVGCLLSGVLLALVAVQAALATYHNLDQRLTTLPAGVWLMYLPLALGSVHSLLHLARLAWRGSLPVEKTQA